MDKNPFSLYDFLGYFIPGSFALYLIILAQNPNGFVSYFDLNCIQYLTNDISFIYIIFFIIVAYILGHTLSFISTLTVENFTIWLLGYPSKNLLGVKRGKYFSKKIENNRTLILQTILSYLFRSILLIILLPISIFVFSVGYFLGINYTAFSKDIKEPYIDMIKCKISVLFSNHNKVIDIHKDDFHKYLIHYCYDKCPSHQSKLMNYVALYGFLRVITLILNFFSVFQLCNLLMNYKLNINEGSIIPLLIFISTSFITYISYLSYLKFYRRYSQENLMILLLINDV